MGRAGHGRLPIRAVDQRFGWISAFSIDFTGASGRSDWKVKASTGLRSFSIDKTPDTVFTEVSPGIYRADISVAGDPDEFYFRVE